MRSTCLRLAVFIALVVTHTEASSLALKQPAGAKLNSLLQRMVGKALPVTVSAALLFAPLPLDALPSSLPELRPHDDQRTIQGQEYVGRAVFFELEGRGQRGVVTAVDGFQAHIVSTTGPAGNNQEEFERMVIPLEQIEATLDFDYNLSGNFVVFVPGADTQGLATKVVGFPRRISVSEDGRLEIDTEGVKSVEITLGTIAATADEGRYLIKPYHFAPFPPDPHNYNNTATTAPHAHRDASSSPLKVKHFHQLNTGLHLVSRENILSGLEQVMLEETEINAPFFAKLAHDDHKREANFAAQQAGQPLPHREGSLLPAISAYQAEEFVASDFVGSIIYYYDGDGNKYLAHASAARDGRVEVRLPGGRETRLIDVAQIRATSVLDGNGALGNGISFFGAEAFPLYHSVRWQGQRLPGARGDFWVAEVRNGAIVASLDNGLLVVKVVDSSVNGVYVNYNLYVVHSKDNIFHFGNHHHRTRK